MNQASSSGATRIAVLRALRGLGDLLCAVPALRGLRAAWPDAQITLLGLPGAHWFVDRYSRYIDNLLEFPGFPGIPESAVAPRATVDFLARAQSDPFDLAIQMHGSGVFSNVFTALLGARATAGFYLPGQYCPDPGRFLLYPAHEPEVRRNLLLVQHLGAPLVSEALEFPIRDEDRQELERVAQAAGWRPADYVCIHAGANDPDRRWGPERFAAVADGLADQGFQIVLTGSAGEMATARQVAQAMRAPAVNLAGATGLGALAALLDAARLLVCNDTGVSHLAAALRTPSVVIFLASDPVRWAPLNRRLHRPVWAGLHEAGHGQSLATLPRHVLLEAQDLLVAQGPRERQHAA